MLGGKGSSGLVTRAEKSSAVRPGHHACAQRLDPHFRQRHLLGHEMAAGTEGSFFLLRRGVWLEATTVSWNIVEGVIAVGAGALASSVALIGFGSDSFVETTSGAVVGWRCAGSSDSERKPARVWSLSS